MKTTINYRYLLLLTLTAALGGFLFGYDTAVVSGAIGFLKVHFQLTADLTGWAASSLLVGCMFGAMAAGPAGDRFGRKPSLILCALLFAASSLASALPGSLAQFAWSRFAGGVAIGAASIGSGRRQLPSFSRATTCSSHCWPCQVRRRAVRRFAISVTVFGATSN